MLTTATKRKIDTARDILVGKIPVPTSQVEQITLALVYKFMSDMDKRAKDLGDSSGFFANGYGKYAWDNLMDKSLPARDRVLLYREALEKMSLNPHIPQLFRDVFRDASLPFNDPETLKLFLDVIDQFEYDHSEELGNAFEYLLQVMGSQGDAGQFRTPRHIIDFIVDVVEPSKTDKILDPACGTAGFLISAYKHIKNKGLSADEMTQLSENFIGYDISQDMQRLSLVNLYLHHFPNPHIYEYDTLTSEDRWNDDFDVILANPPFMTPKGGIRPHNRFSVPSKRAEVLFVDYIMEHLTARGKAGVIVPEGIIFQSQNAYKQLRKMMVEENYLWAVVSLPSGVFNPYSGVKTSILLFDREIAKKTNNVLFVRIDNDGFDLGAQRKEIAKNDLPKALVLLKQYKQKLIEGKETEIQESDKSHFVEKRRIRDEDYVLTSERYKSNNLLANTSFETVTIGEACEIFNGSTPLRSNETYWKDGTIPWFTIKDMRHQGRIIRDTSEKITQKAFNETSVKLLPANTVLLCCTASVGEFAFSEIPLTTNQQFNGLVVKEDYADKLLPKFLFWLSSTFKTELERLSGKTSFNFVAVGTLKKVEIPLPPLSVQQEIVAELDRYQKIIDGAKQVVEYYSPEIDSNGEIAELGTLVTIKTGKLDSNAAVENGEYPFFTCAKETFKIDRYSFDTEAILLAGNNASGDFNVKHYKGKFDAYQRTYVITINDENQLSYRYLYYLLDKNLKSFKKQSIGTNTRYLRIGMITGLRIPLPNITKQLEIVNELDQEANQMQTLKDIQEKFGMKMMKRIESIWADND